MVRVSFRSTSCHVQFLSPNKPFYYFTSLHGLQDVGNHCAYLRDIELKTGRKMPYLRFPHVLFYIYYIDTDEIPGFLLLLKNNIFTAHTEDTIFIFHV